MDEREQGPKPLAKPVSPLELLYKELLLVKGHMLVATAPYLIHVLILLLLAYMVFGSLDLVQYPVWLKWALFLTGTAVLAGVGLAQRRLIQRYRRLLPGRLRQAGLVERLALGLGALPDIFLYTRFPGQMFMGSRPRTLAQHVRLLVQNLDWYLLPEPKPFFRSSWIYYTVMFVYSGWQIIDVIMYIPGTLSASMKLLNSVTVIYIFWMCVIALIMLHELVKLYYCVDVLQEELQCWLVCENADDSIAV